MTNTHAERFLGNLHDSYFGTDPRVNQDLARSLNGLNVVIAGAGRGIGRAAAELFSHGAPKSLGIVSLEQDELDETARLCLEINKSIRVKTGVFDVSDPTACRDFLERMDEDFGGIDVIVMNAGRPPQWLPVAEGDPDIWWNTVEVSLRGAYNFSRYGLPIMQRRKQGRIIFTSSAGAHSNRGISSYILAKLSMVRLAEIIHVENFKDYNIKAFAIHPGSIPTRFYHDFKDKAEGRTEQLRYLKEGVEGEEKSARVAMSFFEKANWDTPYMAAGMMTALASGQLDCMSGRYVDSALRVEDLVEQREAIAEHDRYRVRLNAGEARLIPKLDF